MYNETLKARISLYLLLELGKKAELGQPDFYSFIWSGLQSYMIWYYT